MVDIIDPVLRSSNAYRDKQAHLVKKPLNYIGVLIIFLIIFLFIFIVSNSILDTKPEKTIEINPALKNTPGSDSPTGRIPTIPTLPSQTP